ADPLLARAQIGCGDDELAAAWLVTRHGPEIAHVGAARALGHRKAAQQLRAGDRGQQRMVLLGPEPLHAAAEQPELDAELHDQAQIEERQRLESRHELPDVAARSEAVRIAPPLHEPGGRDRTAPAEDLLAVRLRAQLAHET